MSLKYVSHPQDQNGDDAPVWPVQNARKHSPEAANVACPPARFICLGGPVYLFCHRRILPLYGHHPSTVCKEHQGNRGLSWFTLLISKVSQFGTINGSSHFKNIAPQWETRYDWIHPTLGWQGCRWEKSPLCWHHSFLLSHWSPTAVFMYKSLPKSGDLGEVSKQQIEAEGEGQVQKPTRPQ